MTDLATGLYAHGAIMAALMQRMHTGKGQKINCDLLSTQVCKKKLVMGSGIPKPEFFQYPTYPIPTFQISGIPVPARTRHFTYPTHH